MTSSHVPEPVGREWPPPASRAGTTSFTDHEPPAPRVWSQDPDTGAWEPAEPLPFHYGALARLARWFTRGRWPR